VWKIIGDLRKELLRIRDESSVGMMSNGRPVQSGKWGHWDTSFVRNAARDFLFFFRMKFVRPQLH
jgi:hypothetical protein